MSENIDNILGEIHSQIRENDYEIFIGFSEQGKSRFMIQPVIKKMLEDDRDRILSGLKSNYEFGKSQFEKNPEKFSNWYQNSHDCGVASARDYICYESAKKFLDEMTVGVTFLEGDTEYTTLGVIDKYSRKSEEDERNRRIESQKVAEFWKGYDQRRIEEQEEKAKKPKNKGRQGFLGWFFGDE